MSGISLFTIFLTGLTTGGLTCLAIQGGLLTSIIAKQEKQITKTNNTVSVVFFLLGKILIHTLLGALLGTLGQTLTFSPITRGWIQITIGLYLLGIAGNLLNLHPLFRYFVIKPPKFLARLTKNESQSQSLFAPFLLGLTTVFIPCAVTQATEVIAIGSGNPLYGAVIMFAFILGTSPTFLLFGFLLNSGAKAFQKYFPQIAAIALIGMSVYTINNGIGLTGSIYTIQNFYQVAVHPDVLSASADNEVTIQNGFQIAQITVTNGGYAPQLITLQKDIPVRLTLKTIDVQSCSRAFTIPALNIQKLLPQSGETIIEFTPKTLGPLAFSCSMGMYTGRFNIIN
ncbi:MAG TPA: sulfite exporter TauE/SafE family protein [Spirochaetia bacterium]|nr:sulfite exporter TauE/SafE family protein [Spirochaetia bacterium]